MLYHYVIRTYCSYPLLNGNDIVHFLYDEFFNISQDKEFEILECEILIDHVHLLIEQSYLLSNSDVMKSLKGISARRIFSEFPTNRYKIRKLWARSFYCRKVKNEDKEKITEYIKSQRNRKGIDKRFL